MEYLLLYANGTDPQPYDPAEDDIGAWVADVVARDVVEFGVRLRPWQDATTVRVRNGRTLVTEGPYSEAREWLLGFDILECDDLDEVLEIASRHPVARTGTVTVRPFDTSEPAGRLVPEGLREDSGRHYLMAVCAQAPGGEDTGTDPEEWVSTQDAAGVRLFGEVLRPISEATEVRRRGGRVLLDQPVAPAGPWIAGIDLIQSDDLAGAVAVAAGHPMAAAGLIVLSPTWPFDPDGDHVARTEREAEEVTRRTEPSAPGQA